MEKPEANQIKTVSAVKRIDGYLQKVVTVFDSTGKVVNEVITPLMAEFRYKDAMQIVVGASIMALPFAFTEEVWNLGTTLPLKNALMLLGISIFFIANFVFANFYRYQGKGFVVSYIIRVLSTYFLSAFIVAVILTIIQKCPWGIDNILALKRIMIVSFPASMAATISDTLK